jgi:hypothetical protein
MQLFLARILELQLSCNEDCYYTRGVAHGFTEFMDHLCLQTYRA